MQLITVLQIRGRKESKAVFRHFIGDILYRLLMGVSFSVLNNFDS